MALFKSLRGKRENLPSSKTDGYAYFCTDDGTFWIDYKDENGVVQRKQINADEAAKLTTSRAITVNLSSEGPAAFDGSTDITPGVSNTLGVTHGGTGRTSIPSGNYLIGNLTGAFMSKTPTEVLSDIKAVGYGAAQSLSDAQKVLARSNINAQEEICSIELGSNIYSGTLTTTLSGDNVSGNLNIIEGQTYKVIYNDNVEYIVATISNGNVRLSGENIYIRNNGDGTFYVATRIDGTYTISIEEATITQIDKMYLPYISGDYIIEIDTLDYLIEQDSATIIDFYNETVAAINEGRRLLLSQSNGYSEFIYFYAENDTLTLCYKHYGYPNQERIATSTITSTGEVSNITDVCLQADSKTDNMTLAVGRDSYGKLYAEMPGADDVKAVSYNTVQTLTDGQKTQARENIGAAPESHVSDTNVHISSDERLGWNKGIRFENQSIEIPSVSVASEWQSITYGNGKFIAISQDPNIVNYSTDGIFWKATRLPISKSWHAIAYGNGKFVAVAQNSDVAIYSEDGINWTQTTLPKSGSWYSVAYGNGKFVAIVYNSNIAAYSEDGINWTESTLPSSANWQSTTYGNGKFVAIAFNSNIAAYSEDGINWTQTTLPKSGFWYSVAYGNGKFVAVIGINSNIAAYSEDGINWTQTTLPKSGFWYSVAYGDGKFVTLSYNNSNSFMHSSDGINWTESTLPSSADWQSTTYGNGKFVAIAFNSKISAYSEDGINWTQSIMLGFSDWDSVTYGNGKFVAVAQNSDIAIYSEDGINWTQTTMPSSKNWTGIAYGNGKFVAIVYNSNIAAYSEDGINWTQTTMPSSKNWTGIAYGNGKFVAIAYSSNIVAYSEDGINWTQTTLPSSANWKSTTYGNGKFVAIVYNSNIAAYSEDGINWTQTTMPKSMYWFSVTYGNGKFVAIESSSNIVSYSEDGINWTETTMPSSENWRSVTYGNGKFIATGYNSNIVMCSNDGITWDTATLPFKGNWYAVTYGDDKFVTLTSESNVIAYSIDGTSWSNNMNFISDTNGVDITENVKTMLGIDQPVTPASIGAAIAPTSITITLSAASWDSSAKTQTVTCSGVLSDETAQLITPVPALASQTAYYDAGILCTGQAANSLTFTCKTVPTADLTVYVIIQEVGA